MIKQTSRIFSRAHLRESRELYCSDMFFPPHRWQNLIAARLATSTKLICLWLLAYFIHKSNIACKIWIAIVEALLPENLLFYHKKHLHNTWRFEKRWQNEGEEISPTSSISIFNFRDPEIFSEAAEAKILKKD